MCRISEGVRMQARSAVRVSVFALRPAPSASADTTWPGSGILDGRRLGRSYQRQQGGWLFLRRVGHGNGQHDRQ